MIDNFFYLECDNDGKILYFDPKLEIFFKNFYLDENIRIFNLVHPDYVVDFIDYYNNALNNVENLNKKIIFCNKNGDNFYFNVSFTKNLSIIKIKLQKTDLKFRRVYDVLFYIKKFIFYTRLKFTVGSLMPLVFCFFWSLYRYNNVSYILYFLVFISVLLFHISANTFNDYFDWISNRDKENMDYVLSSTGGSRAIDFKLVSSKFIFYFSWFCFFLIFLISLYLIYVKGVIVLILGLIAVFSVYFYSAPPIHLASRHGLGEFMHIIALGPLLTYGCVFVISSNVDFLDFFIGLPNGLLITGCLLINECPDSKFDKVSRKNNLAVLFGYKYIPYIYIFFLFLSFFIILFLCYNCYISIYFYLILFLIPYLINVSMVVFNIMNENRIFIADACLKSLKIYIIFNITLSIASLLGFIFP